jgi:Nif-specific regulatory protein
MIWADPENSAQGTGMALIQRELRVVQLLFNISQALNRSLNLEEMMRPVLTMISEHVGMIRGTVILLSPETGEIEIELTHGLPREAQSTGSHRSCRRIEDKVVETGIPAVVEMCSQKPSLLDESRIRIRAIGKNKNHISVICVPIRGSDGTMGAISIDRPFSGDSSLDEDVRLLTIIATLVAQAVEIRREAGERERTLREEKERLQSEILDHFKPANIVGNSHAVRQICRLINRVSSSRVNVLITGESGVGKELVAEAIHVNSPRADKPLVKVNLAALSESVMESELFGHERGAFTGAVAMRKGQFEMADGATIFLDEIGVLPIATQAKLLRVLQGGEFERLGGDKTIRVDVRIISATNRDIEELIRNFKFRPDLYYRLNLFPIFVPRLRERKTDILLLADYFVERACRKHGKSIGRISASAIDMMMGHHWPGNIRQLENCIERAVLLSTDGVIYGHHFPPSLQTSVSSNTPPRGNLKGALASLEREMIVDALESERGDNARAAQILGISQRLLRLRIASYGIDLKRFRHPANILSYDRQLR